MLRYVLLALLADGKPAHGYGLMKAYEERSSVRVSIGNVYRELQRLLADGLIVTVENPGDADARRTPYAITEHGREMLASWLATPACTVAHPAPDPLSYRLALLEDLDAAHVEAFLDDLYGELWSQTKAVERDRSLAVQASSRRDRMLAMRSILLGRRARHLAADLDVIEEIRGLVFAWRNRLVARRTVARPSAPVRRSKSLG